MTKRYFYYSSNHLPIKGFSSTRTRLLTVLLLKRRVLPKMLTKSELLKCSRRRKETSGISHIGVNRTVGAIHTVVTIPANVHEVTQIEELRNPDNSEVIGDSRHLGIENRESTVPERITYTAANGYN